MHFDFRPSDHVIHRLRVPDLGGGPLRVLWMWALDQDCPPSILPTDRLLRLEAPITNNIFTLRMFFETSRNILLCPAESFFFCVPVCLSPPLLFSFLFLLSPSPPVSHLSPPLLCSSPPPPVFLRSSTSRILFSSPLLLSSSPSPSSSYPFLSFTPHSSSPDHLYLSLPFPPPPPLTLSLPLVSSPLLFPSFSSSPLLLVSSSQPSPPHCLSSYDSLSLSSSPPFLLTTLPLLFNVRSYSWLYFAILISVG